jgi:hypothetical protein
MKTPLLLFSLALVVLCGACDSGFEAVNENQNQPTDVSPSVLLPNVLFEASGAYLWDNWNIGQIAAQHGAQIQFGDWDRYKWDAGTGSLWNGFYGILSDVKDIERRGQAIGNPNYEAIALILKSWMMHNVTDGWIDVPYAEAGRAEDGIYQPAYDRQEEIYAGLLADLERADGLIDESGTVEGDLLYGGDMTRWRKFGNSLHLRLLLRASKQLPDVASRMAVILANAPIFEQNADNAIYDFTGQIPNDSPVSQQRDYDFTRHVPSQNFMNRLLAYNDPRLFVWTDPTDNSAGTAEELYIGLPNGLSEEGMEQFNGGENNVSVFDRAFLLDQGAADAILMTYAEVQFILAEAALRGWIAGDAKAYYEAGVQASFEQWGVAMPADYFSATQPYDGTLDRIIEQKWFALFFQGLEAWYDYRRTGLPELLPGPANVNGDRVPRRFLYPSTEQSLNADNYQAAVDRLGGDNINISAWWE